MHDIMGSSQIMASNETSRQNSELKLQSMAQATDEPDGSQSVLRGSSTNLAQTNKN